MKRTTNSFLFRHEKCSFYLYFHFPVIAKSVGTTQVGISGLFNDAKLFLLHSWYETGFSVFFSISVPTLSNIVFDVGHDMRVWCLFSVGHDMRVWFSTYCVGSVSVPAMTWDESNSVLVMTWGLYLFQFRPKSSRICRAVTQQCVRARLWRWSVTSREFLCQESRGTDTCRTRKGRRERVSSARAPIVRRSSCFCMRFARVISLRLSSSRTISLSFFVLIDVKRCKICFTCTVLAL